MYVQIRTAISTVNPAGDIECVMPAEEGIQMPIPSMDSRWSLPPRKRGRE